MLYADEPFVKVYRRWRVELLAQPWPVRTVWWELVLVVDRTGVISLPPEVDVFEAVAALLHLDLPMVRAGLGELLRMKWALYVPEHRCLFLPDHEASQEARASGLARVRSKRDRDRARLRLLQATGSDLVVFLDGGRTVYVTMTTAPQVVCDRLSQGRSEPLSVLLTLPGSRALMDELADRFKPHRVSRHDGWYFLLGTVKDFVEEHTGRPTPSEPPVLRTDVHDLDPNPGLPVTHSKGYAKSDSKTKKYYPRTTPKTTPNTTFQNSPNLALYNSKNTIEMHGGGTPTSRANNDSEHLDQYRPAEPSQNDTSGNDQIRSDQICSSSRDEITRAMPAEPASPPLPPSVRPSKPPEDLFPDQSADAARTVGPEKYLPPAHVFEWAAGRGLTRQEVEGVLAAYRTKSELGIEPVSTHTRAFRKWVEKKLRSKEHHATRERGEGDHASAGSGSRTSRGTGGEAPLNGGGTRSVGEKHQRALERSRRARERAAAARDHGT